MESCGAVAALRLRQKKGPVTVTWIGSACSGFRVNSTLFRIPLFSVGFWLVANKVDVHPERQNAQL